MDSYPLKILGRRQIIYYFGVFYYYGVYYYGVQLYFNRRSKFALEGRLSHLIKNWRRFESIVSLCILRKRTVH